VFKLKAESYSFAFLKFFQV